MGTFNQVWEKIQQNVNQEFNTKRGVRFSYRFCGEQTLIITTKNDRDSYSSLGNVQKAFELGKSAGPGVYNQHGVGGSSYVWGILHNPRISAFD